MRDGAIVVPEPFLRLFEVTTDDVDERIDRDLHRRIESVEVVHGDHARVHVRLVVAGILVGLLDVGGRHIVLAEDLVVRSGYS